MIISKQALTPDENKKYLEDMMTKWDIENSKREAVEEARAEGEAKGKAEEKMAIAANMLEDRVPVETIVRYTGLSEADVLNLKK